MIVIIDYNMGNLRSVANAIEALEGKFVISSDIKDITNADGIILPGVGAFGDGMSNLKRLGLIDTIHNEVIKEKKPYLGICLGMQFLAKSGKEHGIHNGFGWIKGTVRKIKTNDTDIKIPHIGWNNVKIDERTGIYRNFEDDPVFYFVHSYFFDTPEKEVITGIAWHGETITASIMKDNIFGVQFHPEKSQGHGLRLLKNFLNIVEENRTKR